MDALGIAYALITIMAWGSWLVPSQNIKFPNEQSKTFFVAIATLTLAFVVIAFRGELGTFSASPAMAWFPVLGGLIWSGGAYCAFLACNHIGLAKAFGIWAALNIIVSFVWGIVLYKQFVDSSSTVIILGLASVLVVIGGIFLILFSGDESDEEVDTSGRKPMLGIIGAVGAGVLWGTFYIPSNYASTSSEAISNWFVLLPLAIGMVIGTTVLVAASGKKPKLNSPLEYARAMSSGVLWGIGAFCMLLTVAKIGPGPGYTLASLCVVVNALWGIFLLKDPRPGTRAANLTLVGIVLATLAGMVLGKLETVAGWITGG